ncbi:MAG: hypothetical protein FWE67_05770 [Planctomycetaceae bacterium]|nr:hypothetical protein [Planctomycetaceae bacterium]
MLEGFSAKHPYTVSDTALGMFSEIKKIIEGIDNESVKEQALSALSQLARCLKNKNVILPHYSTLSAAQTEDGACLIEWHFPKTHIGLSFELQETESYYFLVSIDETANEVETKTKKINGELNKIISNLVQFVINNT